MHGLQHLKARCPELPRQGSGEQEEAVLPPRCRHLLAQATPWAPPPEWQVSPRWSHSCMPVCGLGTSVVISGAAVRC